MLSIIAVNYLDEMTSFSCIYKNAADSIYYLGISYILEMAKKSSALNCDFICDVGRDRASALAAIAMGFAIIQYDGSHTVTYKLEQMAQLKNVKIIGKTVN